MSDVVGSSCLCFQFATGSGKTTMAKEAVKAVQTLSGRSVIVLAPSSAAVETLKDSSFRAADTLANFQYKDYLQDRARVKSSGSMRPAFCRPGKCVGRSISRAATLAG